MRNAFEILQVAENVTDDILAVVFKRLAYLHHPDRAESPAEKKRAENKLKDIVWAHETLSDATKRRAHLRELHPMREAPSPRRHERRDYTGVREDRFDPLSPPTWHVRGHTNVYFHPKTK